MDIVLWHLRSYFCFSKSPLTLWEGEGRYHLIITRWRWKSDSLAILHGHSSVEGHLIAGWEWNFRPPCFFSQHSSSRERDSLLPLVRGGSSELSCVLYWYDVVDTCKDWKSRLSTWPSLISSHRQCDGVLCVLEGREPRVFPMVWVWNSAVTVSKFSILPGFLFLTPLARQSKLFPGLFFVAIY